MNKRKMEMGCFKLLMLNTENRFTWLSKYAKEKTIDASLSEQRSYKYL